MRAWCARGGALAAMAVVFVSVARGDAPRFTDAMPREEFAERRARVFAAIGGGVAVLQGAAGVPGYVRFRQSNQFFYLTGVEVPRAMLLLDGRTREATLFLPPRNEALERSEGPVLVPGDEAAVLTGIPSVQPRAAFASAFKAATGGGRTVYTPFRAEVGGAGTPHAAAAHAEATSEDRWDGRASREQQFIWRLERESPGIVIEDLDPVLDRLRLFKSPREVALIREATRLSGAAIMEVIRSAQPGMREHHLEAIGDYIFKHDGAQGAAYFALVAAGANAYYPHYHGGRAELKGGDLVLYDYAPDYHYYASDVTRMFPVSGRWTAAQRELYTVYLRVYQALLASIRPGLAPRDVIRDAVKRMDAVVGSFPFTDDAHRRAAQALVDRYRSTPDSLGHMVGMAVHDVQPAFETLEPGMVFTIEPALTIPESRTYIRLEDVILMTAEGHENLSGFVPIEPDAIEALMAERGRFEGVAPALPTP